MKRLSLVAMAVVGIALGAAACADSPVQPEPGIGPATEVSPSLSVIPNRWDACSLYLPAALCSSPRQTLCDALTAAPGTSTPFDVTRDGNVVATITIRALTNGARVIISAPGRRAVEIPISSRFIARVCPDA